MIDSFVYWNKKLLVLIRVMLDPQYFAWSLNHILFNRKRTTGTVPICLKVPVGTVGSVTSYSTYYGLRPSHSVRSTGILWQKCIWYGGCCWWCWICFILYELGSSISHLCWLAYLSSWTWSWKAIGTVFRVNFKLIYLHRIFRTVKKIVFLILMIDWLTSCSVCAEVQVPCN